MQQAEAFQQQLIAAFQLAQLRQQTRQLGTKRQLLFLGKLAGQAWLFRNYWLGIFCSSRTKKYMLCLKSW